MIGLIGACIENLLIMSSVSSPIITKRTPRFVVLPGFKATSCLTVVLLICLETVLLSTVSNCAKTFYMHWNTTNSIFRIDNTDHIIDVNKGNVPFEYDQVHLICPVYEPGTFDNETEKYIIYNVSKVEYETCRITNANPRIIAICDKPQKLMYFTITFRPFTPQPGGLEFLPGNDYYFISTSSKDDLHRRIGGRCTTNNMKVVFKVCCARDDQQNNLTINGANNGGTSSSSSSNNNINQQQPQSTGVSINTNIDRTAVNGGGYQQSQSTSGGGQNVPPQQQQPQQPQQQPPQVTTNTNNSNVVQSTMSWPDWSHHPRQQQPTQHTTYSSVGQHQQFYPPMTSPRPNINSANPNSNYSPSHKPTKKTNEYDKHPNEVVKNEELTYNSNSSCNLRPTKYLSQFGGGASIQLILSILVISIKFINLNKVTVTAATAAATTSTAAQQYLWWWCQR